MDLREFKPVGMKMMRRNRSQPDTFCQVMRDIFNATDNEEIKLKCRLLVSYAKSIDKKLKNYRSILKNKECLDK